MSCTTDKNDYCVNNNIIHFIRIEIARKKPASLSFVDFK